MFRKALLGVAAVSAFLIVSDAFAGRLEQTTYYPAPDGQYSTLNSTERTCLATSSATAAIGTVNVGIGTTAPINKVCTDTVNCVVGGTAVANVDLTITGSIPQEAWTLVGSGGAAPAFQNNWTNFDASATTYDTAGFFRDKNGIVHLKGVVKGLADVAVWPGTIIFRLPGGYTPMSREVHIVQVGDDATIGSGNEICRLDIERNGDVCIVFTTAGYYRWLSLEGITFRASGY